MEIPLGDLALQSLDLLEWRLHRLEFFFSGSPTANPDTRSQQPITKRIEKLETALHRLAAQNEVVSEILHLQARQPTLFDPPTESPDSDSDTPEPDLSSKAATVLPAGPSFTQTASSLNTLSTTPIPPTSAFTNLISLTPRMAEIQNRQDEQAAQISELRKRSANLVVWWHEVEVLAQGRCWAEWDGRLRGVEREVRRRERVAEEEK